MLATRKSFSPFPRRASDVADNSADDAVRSAARGLDKLNETVRCGGGDSPKETFPSKRMPLDSPSSSARRHSLSPAVTPLPLNDGDVPGPSVHTFATTPQSLTRQQNGKNLISKTPPLLSAEDDDLLEASRTARPLAWMNSCPTQSRSQSLSRSQSQCRSHSELGMQAGHLEVSEVRGSGVESDDALDLDRSKKTSVVDSDAPISTRGGAGRLGKSKNAFFRTPPKRSTAEAPGNGDEFSKLVSNPAKFDMYMRDAERTSKRHKPLVPATVSPCVPAASAQGGARGAAKDPEVEFLSIGKEKRPSRLKRNKARTRKRRRVVAPSHATPIVLGAATRSPIPAKKDRTKGKIGLQPQDGRVEEEAPSELRPEDLPLAAGEAGARSKRPEEIAVQRQTGSRSGSDSRPARSSARLRRRQSLHSPDAVIDLTQGDDESLVGHDSQGRAASVVPEAPEAAPVVDMDAKSGILPHVSGPVEVVSLENPFLQELTDEESTIVNALTTGRRNGDKLATIPSAHITLKRTDFKRLRGARWLNDEVLNAYVALVNDRNNRYFQELRGDAGPAERPRTYMFNTFFYSRLVCGNDSYDYAGVARWTRRAKVDVLEKDLILIPVNIGNHHWVLAGIDLQHKCYLYLDSLGGGGHSHAVLPAIKRWFYDELLDKHGLEKANSVGVDTFQEPLNKYYEFLPTTALSQSPPSVSASPKKPKKPRKHKIPKQRDGGSCGVFTAKIADCLELGVKVYFAHEHINLIRSRMALDLYRRFLPG